MNLSAINVDLYELTMAAAYFQNEVDSRATFELFCYKMPENRSYLVACGLEQAVDFILNLRFSDEDISFLKNHRAFASVKPGFFDYLKNFKFTGNVWAMPEGEVFFSNEPILQVEAPIIEAQILETYLLSIMHLQTLVATKASRVALSACVDGKKRSVVDFGSRRAHGPDAAVLAARASYIAGCAGTSNVCAGKRFGIPIYGTMAHSWVETFDTEEESFIRYCDVFPHNATLLIDTYDTLEGARKSASINRAIEAVRLDSGNLEILSKKVRKILDGYSFNQVKIVASGNLNEFKIEDLVRRKAPIDFFGVGTEMVTSRDMPSLDLIYKLVQIEDKDGIKFKSKRSEGKKTIPGRKQVFRKYAKSGLFSKDIVGLFSEKIPSAAPLLNPVIKDGTLVKPLPDINTIRKYAQEAVGRLPAYYLRPAKPKRVRVKFSRSIKRLK